MIVKSNETRLLFYKAELTLKLWGVPIHLDGFSFIAEAAVLKCLFNYRKSNILYSHIASSRGITSKTVSNSIAYALGKNREHICSVLRLGLNNLYASRVISLLALHISGDMDTVL